jgi:hypothetical protein
MTVNYPSTLLGFFGGLAVACVVYLGVPGTTNDSLKIAFFSASATSFVAVIGFWITFKTSTYANAKVMRLQSATKIAEFRKEWIENLRKAVASHNALATTLVHYPRSLGKEDKPKGIPEDQFLNLTERVEYIEMMLTGTDDNSKKLVEALRAVGSEATKMIDPNTEEFYRARKAANVTTAAIIRAEWTRLKSELEKAGE